jgi:hypothetical protein
MKHTTSAIAPAVDPIAKVPIAMPTPKVSVDIEIVAY